MTKTQEHQHKDVNIEVTFELTNDAVRIKD